MAEESHGQARLQGDNRPVIDITPGEALTAGEIVELIAPEAPA